MKPGIAYIALILFATVLWNDASGAVVLAGVVVGLGFLALKRRRSLAYALVLGGPFVSFGAEAAWSRVEASLGATPAAVADWIIAKRPWRQFRVNSRLSSMSPDERTEVVAALAVQNGTAKRNLRGYELNAVPLAIARQAPDAAIERLCARHLPEIREATTGGGEGKAGHVACLRYVRK